MYAGARKERMMKKNMLGNTGIEVSQVGLGCASYWGMSSFSESTAIDIFLKAVESGVTLFDTGHNYSGATRRCDWGGRSVRSGRGMALCSPPNAAREAGDMAGTTRTFHPPGFVKAVK